MAVHTPDTHVPEFMKNWPEWQRKALLVGSMAVAAFALLASSNYLYGKSKDHQPAPAPATLPKEPTHR